MVGLFSRPFFLIRNTSVNSFKVPIPPTRTIITSPRSIRPMFISLASLTIIISSAFLYFSATSYCEQKTAIFISFFSQCLRTVFGNDYRVLKVRGVRAVFRAVRVTVLVHIQIARAERHHRLYRDDESLL